MIGLSHDSLEFSFPEVHPEAKLNIQFQRTLRIPDDGTDYPLPAGLGEFPIEHVDDYLRTVPDRWLEHGGVMLPMYQSEAMWINFQSTFLTDHDTCYPFAVKIAAGKIDAVTGKPWTNHLRRQPQNYLQVPSQPWLDGFSIEQGVIRQFVAMPLGGGYTAEEQITGGAEFGGLQIMVMPMRRKAFERYHPVVQSFQKAVRQTAEVHCFSPPPCSFLESEMEMGLGAGGRMRQQIYDDQYKLADWETKQSSRCFVHLTNSETWCQITGKYPPTKPPTATSYEQAGMPWFDWYEDKPAVGGSATLRSLKSVVQVDKVNNEKPVIDNDPIAIEKVTHLRESLSKGQVREGQF
ncbi:MAG: hypothetical protein QF408_03735 [Pirellulales bacterium]|jgi:hypothetical protein|nr:hypothetical protein [Pirellulales bacterium]HJN65838.1 hypothetical protein [Pirellulales bacterium]